MISGVLVIFFLLAGLALLGAVSLIWQSHPIHSALSLILVMVSLAGLYLLMGATEPAHHASGRDPRAPAASL